jgi:4-hydroxy-tetrahydrodipicolinate synthase
MRREELKKLLRGVIVATPTPFDEDFEVDYGRMAEMTEWWVENGLVEGKAVIKCVSLMGEGPQLADEEWPHVVRTVVRAAEGRVPVMGCIHAKDTKRSIADALRAQELGATGLQVSAPLFNDPNQDDILRYFEALSDAIEIGIMVYHTPGHHHSEIMPDTFRRMADFEHVMAIKWCQPLSYEYEEMEALAPHFNILENGSNLRQCFRLGGQGFLDEQATAYPKHDLTIRGLMEEGKFDEGHALWDSVNRPLRALYQKMVIRSGGQARLKKAVMTAMGMSMGPMRPPSLPHSAEELDELREILRGFGWPVPEKTQAAAVLA